MYDNNNKFTEKYVASGLYWNYFYHTWKTVSYCPFANAVTFVTSDATITPAASYTLHIDSKEESDAATVYTFSLADAVGVAPQGVNFIQTNELTTNGIAVQKYGALIIPHDKVATAVTLECDIGGAHYKAGEAITNATAVDETITLTKQ